MSKVVSAKSPVIDGKQYHIACGPGDVARSVLLPGDAARMKMIASLWDEAHEVADHRGYHTMTGTYKGVALSATSTGIGGPALAIAIDELARIGADTFIRVGTCGCLQPDMKLGDLVISTGALRLDGASRDFIIPEYPAVSHYQVVAALIKAARELGERYHIGIAATTDSFYAGQGRPAFHNYLPSFKEHILEDMQKAGVKNFEMEGATLLTLAGIFSLRAGMITVVVANRVTDEFEITDEMQKRAAAVASLAVTYLAK